LGESWDRLESWPLFSERVHVAVSKTHRLAGNKVIEPKNFAGERLVIRTYCETSEQFANFLDSQQVQPKVSRRMVSERDYLVMLEANLGVGLMPESLVWSSLLTCVPVKGLDLSRTISVYAVAGRQRPLAVSTLIRLLRAGDWPAQIGKSSLSRGAAA
jgi:DNA-binding transcriptional LysR family regulator